ncbi:hypothetical protein HQP04_17585 [Rhodococcus fascians]|jgi:hypothetical protein|uniref:hypothetical protein n=1 Tax=Rhodococcoides fascians TaxID=1828 RepID=UPI00068C0A08|nr:hypothetical protein [Rhodococcus fascians]OZD41617.1 hypothetical protein CH252_27580 [Rhodococcus sp. 06-1477-1B]OZD54917.1 hypothetical protein CH266_01890 [Rhodococcus sp. 06-1474-1B]AMY54682.1 hypothetical protein A3L23_03357 [Rhodococcus fascians D188]MBW4781091.1 hypothetical protein [Rhodococcus fascians]MBY4013528.1 hypothetical protein [Rhodococcus fascians]
MVGVNSSRLDDITDLTWVDVLPWLDGYVSDRAARLERLGRDEWWLEDSPRETASGGDLEKLLSELADLFVTGHKSIVLSDAFPTLKPGLSVSALCLDTRAATLAGRLTKSTTIDGFLPLTVQDFFAISGTHDGTARELVAAVLGCAVLTDPGLRVSEDDVISAPPVISQLLDDLHELAQWHRIRGRSRQPLVTVTIDDDSPEPIQDVAARIAALTALDLPDGTVGDPIDEIENLVEQLNERESLVLHQRLMAVAPKSLGEMSVRLHVSKARTSTIESDIKSRFTSACGYGTAVGNLLASLRVEIQPVASLDRLLKLHPGIAKAVPALGVPLWLVLDRLDDYFEVTDGWAAAPDVDAAKRRTLSLLEDHESVNGVVDLADVTAAVAMTGHELEEWLRWCEVPLVAGRALTRTAKLADHAVGALEAMGESLSSEILRELVDPGRGVESISRALAADSRVERDHELEWHLAEWSTADIEVEGRAAHEVPQFVADSTGAVRRKRSGVKSPDHTRRLYRVGLGWRYRIVVSRDHLRGSGFALPAGVAAAVGCRRGDVVELSSRLGEQMIRWSGSQPTCGTIRRFLAELAVNVGDSVFLDFGVDRRFDVLPAASIPDDAGPLRRVLGMIGHSDPMSISEKNLVRVLADAIGLPGETRPRRLLSAYETGSDDEVTVLLESAWVSGNDVALGDRE